MDLEVQVGKTDLKDALATLARVCPRGGGSVHLAARNEWLTLTATHDGIAIRTTVAAQVITPGICVLPIRTAIEAVKSSSKIKSLEIGPLSTPGEMHVGIYAVEKLPLDEFRPTPAPGRKWWEIPASELKDAIERVSYAVAPAWDVRPGHRSVWIEQFTNQRTGFPDMLVSACDQWRSASRSIDFRMTTAAGGMPVGIPVDGAQIVAKTFTSGTVDVGVDDGTAAFQQDGTLAVMPRTRPIAVYAADLREELTSMETEVDRLQLLEVAREAADMAGKELLALSASVFPDTGTMLVHIQGSTIERIPDDSKRGYTPVTHPVTATHRVLCRTKKQGQFHVNPVFLAETLQHIDDPSVTLRRVKDVLQLGHYPDLHCIALMRETDGKHNSSEHPAEAAQYQAV